ncbi:MAG TPA: CHAT domain-containing protein, partial [Polyangiaceae bacterium]
VLDRAEQQLARCPNPPSRRNLRLNRIELALKRRDAGQAEVLLRALEEDRSGQSTHLAAWQARAWGELHLLRGDGTQAADFFAFAYQLAESAQLKDCAYLAKLGRARALARQTDHEATLEAYLAAEHAADALVRWAPFGEGQQLTALQTQESSRELVTHLLARKDAARARQAAVRAARRVGLASYHASRLASVGNALRAQWDRAVADYRTRREELQRAARDDWKLSREGLEAQRQSRALQEQELENTLAAAYALLSDESSSESALEPTDDDARLLLAPSSDAWWAFLWRRSVLSVHLVHGSPPSVGLVPRAELRRELERGLSVALEQFERDGFLEAPLLRVAVPPELATLDVHALPLAGRTLIDHIPVAYDSGPHSDAGRRKRVEPPTGQLLLGDPNSDLPWAAAETRRLAKLFPGAKVLLGSQIEFNAVLQHLPNVHLLHFAGHTSSGGLDGMDGALHLDAKTRISLGDVLALAHVPEFVVLSSCASSVSPDVGGGLSIGHAFLTAGARAVVGSSRTISDALAQTFMRELYERLLGDGEGARLPDDIHTWAEGIRAAGRAVRRSDGTADWASIRLLLP